MPLQQLVARLARHRHGLFAHCRYPFSTGILESCNNKITVLECMAYGYRNDAYFSLKIRAAVPGTPG